MGLCWAAEAFHFALGLSGHDTSCFVGMQILKALTTRLTLDMGVSLQEVANACEGFSGADLSALLADAQLEAVHEVLATPSGGDEVSRTIQIVHHILPQDECPSEIFPSHYQFVHYKFGVCICTSRHRCADIASQYKSQWAGPSYVT